jgi:hypothetical protein
MNLALDLKEIKKRIYKWLVLTVSSQDAGVDAEGNMYVSDPLHNCIYKVNPEGEMVHWANCESRPESGHETVFHWLHPEPASIGGSSSYVTNEEYHAVFVLPAEGSGAETRVIFMDFADGSEKIRSRRIFYYYDRRDKMRILGMEPPEKLFRH